jgi:integrase/recombinase XerD
VNFLVAKGWESITLAELNRNFIVLFEHHLLSTCNPGSPKPINGNTATTYLRKLKAVVNNAMRKEILNKHPFSGYKMRSFKKTSRVYLTNEELDAMKNCDLGGNQVLQRVRDFFLFCVYTGLRHSDAYNLKTENVRIDANGVKWITLDQRKTKEPLNVPMLEQAVQIYDKYEAYRQEKGYIIPRLSNQKINTTLKILAGLAGIHKVVSCHVARHTFATTITLGKGVSIKTVSKLLGQTSISSTEIYARVSPELLLDTARDLNKLL